MKFNEENSKFDILNPACVPFQPSSNMTNVEYVIHEPNNTTFVTNNIDKIIKNELTKKEFLLLIETAKKHEQTRTRLIIRVLGETGIRFGELKYITVETVKNAIIKFTDRTKLETKILLNKNLQKELLDYCKENNIETGMIFVGKNGQLLDVAYITRLIQKTAQLAGIDKDHVRIHNFRYFYMKNKIEVFNTKDLYKDVIIDE